MEDKGVPEWGRERWRVEDTGIPEWGGERWRVGVHNGRGKEGSF